MTWVLHSASMGLGLMPHPRFVFCFSGKWALGPFWKFHHSTDSGICKSSHPPFGKVLWIFLSAQFPTRNGNEELCQERVLINEAWDIYLLTWHINQYSRVQTMKSMDRPQLDQTRLLREVSYFIIIILDWKIHLQPNKIHKLFSSQKSDLKKTNPHNNMALTDH